MKKTVVLAVIVFLACFTFCGTSLGQRMVRPTAFVPAPRLLEPVTETVDISGKKDLTFSWSPHEGAAGFRLYYDFRLYKGRQTYADYRIIKIKVDPDVYQVTLGAENFQDGQVYTWSLRQVFDAGRKSDESYSAFTVIKK